MNKTNTKYGKGTICVEGTRQLNEIWHRAQSSRPKPIKVKPYNIDLDPAFLSLWFSDQEIDEIISKGSVEEWEKSRENT